MHHALEIPELVDIVLSYVPKSTLPAVAQTAHRFHLQAASHLWKEMDIPTIEALARIILEPRNLDMPAQQISMAVRWERLQLYGSLVRDLDLDFRHYNASPSFDESMRALALFKPPTQVLLPRLQVLFVSPCEVKDLEYSLMFLSPSLEVFSFYLSPDVAFSDIHIGSLLYRLQGIHGLQSLAWLRSESYDISPCLSRTFGDFLAGVPRLTELHGGPAILSEHALPIIARCSNLHTLVLDQICVPAAELSGLPICGHSTSFLALELLHFDGNIRAATAILNSFGSHVNDLAFDFSEAVFLPEDVGSFAGSVQACSSKLTQLKLVFRESQNEGLPQRPLISQLSALLKCRAITHFRFRYESRGTFAFEDSHLESMARAWPGLHLLEIQWPVRSRASSGVGEDWVVNRTIALPTLRHLAAWCLNFQSLVLTLVDCSDPVLPATRVRSSPQIVNIDMAYAEVKDATGVAGLLFNIWPNAILSPPRFVPRSRASAAPLEAIKRAFADLQSCRT